MNRLLLSILLLLSPISISGIHGLSIINPYNLIGIFLFIILFIKNKVTINYFILFFIFTVLINLVINFNRSGILLMLSMTPVFYEKNLQRINIKIIERFIILHFFLLVLMLLIDFKYRIGFNILKIFLIIKSFILMDKKINFYNYKDNTIMFDDTNYLAIIIGTALLFCIHLEKIKIVKNKYYKLVLSVLLFFTFSRTSYIAIIISFIYYNYSKIGKRYIKLKIIFNYFFILFVLILIPCIFSIFNNDGSFRIRISIIYNFFYYLKNIDIISLIFGVGMSNSTEVLGRYGHNLLIVFFTEGGLLFSLAFINLILYFWQKYKIQRDILIYNFLCLMSVTTYNYIYLMIVLTFLYILERNKVYLGEKNGKIKKIANSTNNFIRKAK